MALEGPDDLITLHRAAEFSGLSVNTVRTQIRKGRLQVKRIGHERLTTRRWLHDYLMERDDTFKQSAPLPPGYVVPGEEE